MLYKVFVAKYLRTCVLVCFMQNSVLTIPNLLCVFRIIMLPVLYAIWTNGHTGWFVGLFLFVGLTDALDGFLARWLNQTTRIGAMLDSVADYLYYAFFAGWFLSLWSAEVRSFVVLLTIPLVIIAGAYGIMLMRFQKIVFLHLYSSKLTAVVAYVFVILTFVRGFNSLFLSIVVSLWLLTALEMLAASIVIKSAQSNVKSILVTK